MTKLKRQTILSVFMYCAFFFCAGDLWPCDAPVFRYALERWVADSYRLYIYHNGPLSHSDNQIVEWLYKNSAENKSDTNFVIETINKEKDMKDTHKRIWEILTADTPSIIPELPLILLMYPEKALFNGIVWKAPLSRDSAERLIHSPARQAIAANITQSGHAIVWVLLQSGKADQDNKTAELISDNLPGMANIINERLTYEFSAISNPLKRHTDFSLVIISRDDPKEDVLIKNLMLSEPGLFSLTEFPMLFPVYGRGRVLYALAGSGINDNTIKNASEFLTGICACEVKETSPGVDLLISADWDSYPGDPWIEEEIVLTSSASMSGYNNQNEEGFWNETEYDGALDERPCSMLATSLFIIGTGLLTVAAVTLLIVFKKRKTNDI